MPAKSEAQRKAMGAALATKEGKAPAKKGQPSAKMAKSMSKSQLKDFAKKPGKKK
jgi:hypothetical protein